jgi:hypothetical protein
MFRDGAEKAFFLKKGYTTFSLLNRSQIDAARNVFSEFKTAHHQHTDKFKGTGWLSDAGQIDAINKKLHAVISPALNKKFQDFQLLGYNFLLKERGADSAVPPHQDWTYVDESRFFSMNIWIALEDSSIENGCLFIIPYSHLLGNYLRSSPSYPVPFGSIIDFVAWFKKPIPLKAGECICFSNKTIHGSYPNLGNTNRLAVVTTLYPEKASLLHYYIHDTQNPEAVTEYEIEKKEFLTLKRGLPPSTYIRSRQVRTQYKRITKPRFIFSWMKALF